MCPDVLEVGEAIEKFATKQVEVAIAVKVGEVRAGPTENVDRRSARGEFDRIPGVFPLVVFDEIDPTVQRSVFPAPLAVIGVIPFIVAPVADPHDEILIAVVFPIDIAPHSPARLAAVKPRPIVNLRCLVEVSRFEFQILQVLLEHFRFAIHVANLNVVPGFSQVGAWFEDRHFHARILGRVLEEIEPVGRFVGTGDHEIEIAVVIVIHRQGPRPEPDAEINLEAGMIVTQGFEILAKNGGGQERKQKKKSAIHRGVQEFLGLGLRSLRIASTRRRSGVLKR